MLWIERLKRSGNGWEEKWEGTNWNACRGNIQNILCEKNMFFSIKGEKRVRIFAWMYVCVPPVGHELGRWIRSQDLEEVWFSSQYFHEKSQPITLVPASQTPSSAFLRPLSHICTHTDVGSHTLFLKIYFRKRTKEGRTREMKEKVERWGGRRHWGKNDGQEWPNSLVSHKSNQGCFYFIFILS